MVGGVFVIEKLLQQTSVGPVFLASHRQLQQKVIARFFSSALTTDPLLLNRFERMAALLGKIKHANIATMVAHDIDPQWGPYLMEEFVEGETLDHFVSRLGALPMGLFVPIASQILKGMGGVHSRGIFHGNLRASRVILAPKTRVTAKVRGVGYLQLLQEFSLTPDIHGDLVAPEQILHGKTDARSDVYALGGLFYWMLSGQSPFHHNGVDKVQQYVHETPAPLESVLPPGRTFAKELLDLVHECLKRNPDERPADGNELVERLIDVAPASMFRMPKSLLLQVVEKELVSQTPLPTPILEEPIAFANEDSLSLSQATQKRRSIRGAVLALVILLIVMGGGYMYLQPATKPKAVENQPVAVRIVEPSLANTEIEALLQSAREFEKEGDSDTALRIYQAILQRDPKHELARSRIAALAPVPSIQETLEKEVANNSQVEEIPSEAIDKVEVEEHEEIPDNTSGEQAEQIELKAVKVNFRAKPAGAQLLVDGQDLGSLPQSIELPVGTHEIEITKSGYEAKKQTLEIKESQDLIFNLKKQKKPKKISRRRHDSENVDIDPEEGVATPIEIELR